MQNTNRSHGFKRDTLVYSLGILTESVIQAALADQELRVHYDCWLLQERRSPSENEEVQKPLIRAGLGCGEVVLLARPQNGQFCIALEHAHFKAVVAATFNVEAGHLCGLSVMRFDGDMVRGIGFSRRLAEEIQRPATDLQGNTWLERSATSPLRHLN